MKRDPDVLLRYEISRKPALKAVLDDLDNLSFDDLDKMSFPLKWIRDGFKRMKQQRIMAAKQAEITAMLDRDVDSIIEESVVTDPEGELVLWTGCDDFLGLSTGGIVSITPDRYVFLPDHGGMFVDNIYSKTIDHKVLQQGRRSGRSTLTGYKRLQMDVRNKACPAGAPVIDLTGNATKTPTTRLAMMGVRIG